MRIWQRSKVLLLVFTGFLFASLFSSAFAETLALAETNESKVPIYYFWGDGCPRCAEQEPFLRELAARYPNVEIHDYEVWYHPENRPLFQEMAAAAGITASGVPTTFIGGHVWVGFQERMKLEMEEAVNECLDAICYDPLTGEGEIVARAAGETCDDPEAVLEEGATCTASQNTIELPIFGTVDLGTRSLVLSTSLIAFVDGFNPCSLWVLSILLALVIHSRSRKKILMVGLTFLTVTAAIYGLFMAGLFSVFAYVSYLTWIHVVVALFALGFAIINIKDYFFYKQGLSFTIADKHKPGIYKSFRNLIAEDRSPFALMGATAAMAAGIALIELPCTAGFPVLWSNILAGQGVDGTTFSMLLGLYLGVYLLDELIVFGTVVLTLKASKLEEKHGRALKLVGGMIMLALALVMVFSPETMNSISGSLVVFGGALAVSLLIMLVHRIVMPRYGLRLGSEAALASSRAKRQP